MRIYLIDGHSLLYRAFHALPQSIATSWGLPANALYGFTSMLLKLLDTEKEIGLAVLWDAGMPEFRKELYPEYKANRSSMPDELRAQTEHLDTILDAMNVPCMRAPGYEADDVIASLSRGVPEGIELSLVTGDQDLMQLVDGQVKVLRTTRGVSEMKPYGREEVIEDYGITPEQVVDYKALTGDSSDNIPGVRGIGPKTAVSLLSEYGTLEHLYAEMDGGASIAAGTRKKLEEGRDMAFVSRDLAQMRFDVPVELKPEELAFRGVSPEAAKLARRYEFRSLLERFDALPLAGGEEPAVESRRVRLVNAPVEDGEGPVAVAPVSVPGTLEGMRWCVAASDGEVHLVDGLPRRPLQVHDAKIVGVRGAHFDTYLAAYLLNPGQGGYDLESIGSAEGITEPVPEGEADPDTARAAREAVVIRDVAPTLKDQLKMEGLERLYYGVELPLSDILGRMERVGMPVDAGVLEEVGEEIDRRAAELEESIYADVGHSFNINSPKQLGQVLFEEMGIEPIKKTKTGYSTDAQVLQQLAIEHPIADKIISYRELVKLKGTYIEGLRHLISSDGRIHTTLNQTTTATGRTSSDSPNLQNIPIRTELGARIRAAFTASPGRKLVVCDYSQIELRILAHMSGEPALVESFTKGEDVHTRTAAEVFDVRPESVTPELRRRAKMVNFGIIYGISGYGLAMRLGNVHPSEAERYIQRYMERYPQVTRFIQKSIEESEEFGYAATLFGRRRYVPELNSSNKTTRKLGERLAVNARIQGTAADIIKIAMVDIDEKLPEEGADMLMQVHDELIFDVAEDRVGEVAALATETMVAACDLETPLEVEVEIGERWGEGETWTGK